MPATNRLAAIVFTDIVGYTKTMQVDQAQGLQLAKKHEHLVMTLAKEFKGQVINFYGDGSLTLFDSAYSAVSFAHALQVEANQKIPIRIGINDGDVTLENGKAYGDAINVASRIESCGHPGSILISQSIYKKIRNRKDWRLVKLGKFRLKNVLEPQLLYAVQGREMASINEKEISHRLRNTSLRLLIPLVATLLFSGVIYVHLNQRKNTRNFQDAKSIAVLPFDNQLASDSTFFTQGIVEDILCQISKIKDVQVMSRYVLKNYDVANKTPKTIGSELNVKYILSGTISNYNDGLRISCHLTETQLEQEVWSENYSVSKTQLFDIQKAVAREIAHHLEVPQPATIGAGSTESTLDVAAYNLYLKGRSGYYEYDPELNTRAISFFKQAIAIDSNYGLAYAALADGLSQAVYSYGTHTPDHLDSAIIYASKAIALSPDEPDTWKSLAFVQDVMGNYEDAKSNYRIALEKAPNFSPALINLGSIYDVEGQLVQAIDMYQKSVTINPVHPNPRINLANSLRKLGQFSQALVNLERAQHLDPDNWYVDYMFAAVYITQHQFEKAGQYIDRFLQMDTSNRFLKEVAGELTRYFDPSHAYDLFVQSKADMETAAMPELGTILGVWLDKQRGITNHTQQLDRIFANNIKAIESGQNSKVIFKRLAFIEVTKGNEAACYRWLRRAIDAGLVDYELLRLEPFFVKMQSQPAFTQLITEMKKNVDEMNSELMVSW